MAIKTRVAVSVAKGRMEIQEIEIPEPGPGEILIRQRACAICTMEQRFFTGVTPRYPGVWGHEVSGVVEAIGPNTNTQLKVGDRVARACGVSCGECYECSMGFNAYCSSEGRRRHTPKGYSVGIPGIYGMSEYALVDPRTVVKLADDVLFEHGCLTEPVACVTQSANKLDIQLGQTVVVIGAGTMGLLNMMVARLRGAFVVVSEFDEKRREKATKIAAHASIDPLVDNIADELRKVNDGRLADVVITAIGSKSANDDALKLLAPQGKMMLFASAHPAVAISVDPNVVHRTAISITGSVSKNRKDAVQASILISKRLIDVSHVVEKVYPFEQVQEAMEAACRGGSYRIVLAM
jgi:threonine dehydrogenase-like Zn-dependent dehydrogenase